MQVDKIKLGSVIDHIKPGKVSKIMKLLCIGEEFGHRVAVMFNVPSKRMGTKDILKIEGKVVSPHECGLIALVSPGATINIIQAGQVKQKYKIKYPQTIEGPIKCPNPTCIGGEYVPKFKHEKNSLYRCHYCERIFSSEELM